MTVGLSQGLFLVRNELDMRVLLILFSLFQDTLQICRVISDDPGSRVVDGYDVVHTDSPFADISCFIYRRGFSALSSPRIAAFRKPVYLVFTVTVSFYGFAVRRCFAIYHIGQKIIVLRIINKPEKRPLLFSGLF